MNLFYGATVVLQQYCKISMGKLPKAEKFGMLRSKLLAEIFGRNGTENIRKMFKAFASIQLIANADITELAAVIGKEAAEKLTAILVLSQGV